MAEFKSLTICSNTNGLSGSNYTSPVFKINSTSKAFQLSKDGSLTYTIPSSTSNPGSEAQPVFLATAPYKYAAVDSQETLPRDVKLISTTGSEKNGYSKYTSDYNSNAALDVYDLALNIGSERVLIRAGRLPPRTYQIVLDRKGCGRIISAKFTPVLTDSSTNSIWNQYTYVTNMNGADLSIANQVLYNYTQNIDGVPGEAYVASYNDDGYYVTINIDHTRQCDNPRGDYGYLGYYFLIIMGA